MMLRAADIKPGDVLINYGTRYVVKSVFIGKTYRTVGLVFENGSQVIVGKDERFFAEPRKGE